MTPILLPPMRLLASGRGSAFAGRGDLNHAAALKNKVPNQSGASQPPQYSGRCRVAFAMWQQS
jgi:hypothetical protein